MAIAPAFVVFDSRDQDAASCVVCGNAIAAGDGVTASFHGRTLRFKCPGCFARFQADPELFLTGHPAGCCNGQHDHSPATEWRCD